MWDREITVKMFVFTCIKSDIHITYDIHEGGSQEFSAF